MSLPGPVVAIAGPTASGKSSLADAVASALGSSVVSVDAMQVYRGMDVGTAKTPPLERRCPLLMVDVCDLRDDYSVRLFQRDARSCVDAILAEGRTPVLCGGTGLYLDAVVDEMEFPDGALGCELRSRYDGLARTLGPEGLHHLLLERDPWSAKLIHPHNQRRVIRALELHDQGLSYAKNHEGLLAKNPHYKLLMYVISMDRKRLYERIDQRVETMFASGLVEEVKGLIARGLTESPTALQAIGYKEVVSALMGSCSMDEAKETIKQRSRRYAKRQLSWIKRDGRGRVLDYERMDEAQALGVVLSDLNDVLSRGERDA
ncbi:tRNA (adenosine(37)-N6)-dimethylallyltransferase MiaA [Olsenella urininfantis]|uniref:tRNA (adenosine(37)-N6)-dimethylallyltransferase MiaA n=1 Tax=Olsenella urininfantis TaxID=1871033 RepID=UPI0009853A17|nr:tRNA (adenosine(37)-N6)-dimethylallyltransferase MiaA [Olsenella urininfantis]